MRSALGHPLAAGLLVGILTCLAYLRAPDSPFQYDDHSAVVDLVPYLDAGEILRMMKSFPAGRPLTQASLALDAWRSGMGPDAEHDFHVTNLALHLLVAGLVYRLALGFFSGNPLAATFSALVFALHPLQAGSADYVINRSTLIAAAGTVSSVLFLLRARDRALAWLVPALLAWLVGLGGKETAAAAPLLGWLALRMIPAERGRARGLETAILAMLSIQAVLYAKILAAAWRGPAGTVDFARTQLWVIPQYLRLTLFPWPMSVLHHLPDAASWGDPRLAWAAAIWGIGLALAWRLGRSRPWLLLAALWWLVSLLPEASIAPIEDRMMEHRTYLAMAGPALAAGWLLARLGSGRAAPAIGVLVLLLILGTMGRAVSWAEPRLLWAEACRVSPRAQKAWINLGQVDGTLGRMPEALRWTGRALGIRPGDSEAVLNLGAYFSELGRPDLAAAYWSQLPDHAAALAGLGNLHQEAGRLDEAETAYRRALQVATPRPLKTVNALGTLMAQRGRSGEAKALFEEAVARKPGYLEARMNLGLVLAEMGREDEAKRELETAARLAPDDPLVRLGLGRLLQAQSERIRASLPRAEDGSLLHPRDLLSMLERAMKENPGDAEIRSAWFRLGEAERLSEEALSAFRHVLIFPTSADRLLTGSRNRLLVEALERMGAIETARGNLSEGCACLRQALILDPGNARIRAFLEANGGLSEPPGADFGEGERPFLPSDLSPGPGPSAR